jgi:hypothetical protein
VRLGQVEGRLGPRRVHAQAPGALLWGPASAHAASSCTSAQLKLKLGRGDGAAGHVYYPLVFTNTSGTACTLRGYPGVSSLTGRHGRRLGKPAAREHGQRVKTVTLKAKGGKATATLDVVNADNFDAHSCRPERAAGLRVYPPGSKKSFYVTQSHRVCTVGNARNRVRPVAS